MRSQNKGRPKTGKAESRRIGILARRRTACNLKDIEIKAKDGPISYCSSRGIMMTRRLSERSSVAIEKEGHGRPEEEMEEEKEEGRKEKTGGKDRPLVSNIIVPQIAHIPFL